MQIDHIGYAVKKLDKAISEFQKLGYTFEEIIDDEDRNLQIVFGENGGYRVELLAPMENLKKNVIK